MDPTYVMLVGEMIAVPIIIVITHFLQQRLIKREARSARIFTDTTLRRLNGTVTAIVHSWPGPAWIKMAHDENGDVVFRMMEINAAGERAAGVSRLAYIGKTDLEAGCPHTMANELRQHDLMVWASGEATIFSETDAHGETGKFVKIRITSPDGQCKGIMGLALLPSTIKTANPV